MPRTAVTVALVGMTLALTAVVAPAPSTAQETECAGNPLAVTPAADETAEAVAPSADTPAWMTLAVTDVCTGLTFTLADFAGRTVYVELMATWCPPCREQIHNARAAKEQLAADDFIFVGLSTEVDLAPETLAAYAASEAPGWVFAVMTPEMLQALVDHFGREASLPPSTPHFAIGPDGAATALTLGYEQPEVIVETLTTLHGS